MKKNSILMLLGATIAFSATAQVPDGSTVTDITVTDMNGKKQNLFSYLNAGKFVIIDCFATWCGPCWNYHESHALRDFYNAYGSSGQNIATVLGIEGDAGTKDTEMSSWTNGTPFPMSNPTGTELDIFYKVFKPGGFPCVYMICPNKKVTMVTGQTKNQLYNTMMKNKYCPAPVTSISDLEFENGFSVFPNPAGSLFTIAGKCSAAKVHYSIFNSIGKLIKCGDIFGNGDGFEINLNTAEISSNAGIYIIKVDDKNSSWSQRLIIQ